MIRLFAIICSTLLLIACAHKNAPPAPTTDEFSYTPDQLAPTPAPSTDAAETAARM